MWALAALLLLLLVGAALAAAESGLVALRPAQVGRLAQRRRRGPQLAELVDDAPRLRSAVRIASTGSGFLAAAVAAAGLTGPVAGLLRRAHLGQVVAGVAAFLLVTAVVVYLWLVVVELTAQRLAPDSSTGFALAVAGPVEAVARIVRPAGWLVRRSSDILVRVLGGDPARDTEEVTEDTLRDLVAANAELTRDERRMISQVLNAGDRPIREVMVPRLDVSALQLGLSVIDALTATADRPYSRYPVVDGGLDDVVGFVHLRDLVRAAREPGPPLDLAELARPLLRLPDTRRALPALAQMRRERAHLAIVVDEYGGSAGIVTLEDLLEELVGDITDEFDVHQPGDVAAVRPLAGDRDDAVGEEPDEAGPDALPVDPVNAQLRLDEFAEQTGLALPEGPYDTAAGWLVHQLGRIPAEGDHADVVDERHGTVRVTAVAIRGRRVDRVRLDPPVTVGPDR